MIAAIEHGDGVLDRTELMKQLDALYEQSRDFGYDEH